MKKILVAGSIAYDHLMTFDGNLQEQFIEEKMEHLSVSFQSKTHEIHFGGCAANIAYNLSFFQYRPCVYSVAGNDFEKYQKWFREHNIDDSLVQIDEGNPTAAAYILSDNDHRQITIFSLGALSNTQKLSENAISRNDKFDYAIVSPGFPFHMLYFAQCCLEAGIPYLFDPGQGIPVLGSEALLTLIDSSRGVILNNYEADLLTEKLGMTLGHIAERVPFLIRTLGANGVELFHGGKKEGIPALKKIEAVDGTGCGDAFRAGLIYGLLEGNSLEVACKIGQSAASFVAEKKGTQNHKFTLAELNKRLLKNYS